jgi:hypothetical protein
METLKLDNNSSKQGILTMKGGRLTFIHHAEQKGSGFCLYYLGRANEKDGMTTLPMIKEITEARKSTGKWKDDPAIHHTANYEMITIPTDSILFI